MLIRLSYLAADMGEGATASGQGKGLMAHPRLSEYSNLCLCTVPPAGFEPALTAPEAVALSPELRGLKDGERLPATDGRRVGHVTRQVH